MPQALTVGDSSLAGTSAKRQRSADSREVSTRPTSAGRKASAVSLSKSNVRIPQYLDKSKADISTAFQDLEWKQRFRLFHALENPTTSPFRVDRSDVVISRNRYGNVQPWDNSRIMLQPPIAGSDYVNASPIILRSRSVASKTDASSQSNDNIAEQSFQENKYIATQGPKQGLISHFWRMVMQETTGDTGVVVMLTQCYEANKEKCARYFPADLSDPIIVLPREEQEIDTPDTAATESEDDADRENSHAHPVEATSQDSLTLKSIESDHQTGSKLRIIILTINGQSKTIYHYLYHGWPDFGKPEAEDRLALIELTRQTRKITGESPRIVHCSAGVGRTGTFIALDFLIREIEEDRILDPTAYSLSPSSSTSASTLNPPAGFGFRDEITPTETWGKSGPPKVKTPTTELPSGEENNALRDDLIYQTVNTLREQRMMMVMNELQYAFLYEVVREVFLEKYRARPEGAVVKTTDPSGTDLPRGKVARLEVGDDGNSSGEGAAEASASEAETEIMDGDELNLTSQSEERDNLGNDKENDPYSAVAPESLREGVEKQSQ